jgi:hypothetical protein
MICGAGSSFFPIMRTALTQETRQTDGPVPVDSKELFRARFQTALRQCVRRRFSVAECFGVIWEETLEDITLTEKEQSELYEELIDWAKRRLFHDFVEAPPPSVFT